LIAFPELCKGHIGEFEISLELNNGNLSTNYDLVIIVDYEIPYFIEALDDLKMGLF
jgi:hypothetical protein